MPEGVQIKCETADEEYAVLQIRSEVKNRKPIPAEMTLHTVIRNEKGDAVGEEKTVAVLFDQEQRELTQRIVIGKPEFWSAETPILYTCEATLMMGEEVVDAQTEKFGIRTMSLDAKRGLRINGESVKLRGACITMTADFSEPQHLKMHSIGRLQN